MLDTTLIVGMLLTYNKSPIQLSYQLLLLWGVGIIFCSKLPRLFVVKLFLAICPL